MGTHPDQTPFLPQLLPFYNKCFLVRILGHSTGDCALDFAYVGMAGVEWREWSGMY